jgi:hypothetical protein
MPQLFTGLVIIGEVFAYGALLEPSFTFISEYEDIKMRFYVRERKLTKFYSRMIALERKYSHIRFVESHETVTHELEEEENASPTGLDDLMAGRFELCPWPLLNRPRKQPI